MHEGRDLEAVFRRVEYERMQDVYILNRKLSVEAVGFSDWRRYPLGVLITPWFMNLVWLSESSPEHGALKLPCGEIGFMPCFEPDMGRFQICPLFSPMHAFPDQDAARKTAIEVLRLIFAGDHGCSRRDFLRGNFL